MVGGGHVPAMVTNAVVAIAAFSATGSSTSICAGDCLCSCYSCRPNGTPGAAAGDSSMGRLCCLHKEGEMCSWAVGNSSFSKLIQKSISLKKVKIELDMRTRYLRIRDAHKGLIPNVLNRRKRKGSYDNGDSPVQVLTREVNNIFYSYPISVASKNSSEDIKGPS